MAKLSELLSTIRSTALKKNPGRSLFQLGLPNILQGGEGGTVWVKRPAQEHKTMTTRLVSNTNLKPLKKFQRR